MHVLIPALHRPIKPTGVCRHAANLAHCLADLDSVDRITLLIGQWQTTYFKQTFHFESPKVQSVSVDIKNGSLARNWWFMFGLPQLSKQLKPDIIHMSFPFPFVRQWFEAPIVATIHDLYPYECPENFGYPQVLFNQLFLRQCIRNSDGLSCVSKCTLETLDHYFTGVEKQKQRKVIYNVVDFTDISPTKPEKLVENNAFPFLLTVAQHRRNKNLDLLIQAYGLLLDKRELKPDTKLLIVGGSGPETDNLTRLIQSLKLDEQVLFMSGIDDGELRWLYEHAKLFVIPSSTEGFCLPLVEALTLNCPVVCSDIPIFREVGLSRCYYFDLENNPALNLSHTILTSLTEQSLLSNYSELRFSKDNVAQSLINFYDSVQTA